MAHPLKEIDKIKFGIFSPDEIRKMSVTRIITADTYDEDGLPIDSGLMDGRLGTIEPGQRCKTCGNRVGECPGHFGHIELARPVIHVGFASKIQKILRAICRKCSRLIVLEDLSEGGEDEDFSEASLGEEGGSGGEIEVSTPGEEEEEGVAQKDEVLETLKKTTKLTDCPYCGAKQMKIKLEKPTTFYEKQESGTNRLNPSEIRDRFERMTDEDCRRLGINPDYARPEWMILTVLPIPPVCVRPSITLDSGVRSEDDLTHKLVDIIRINQRLRENIEAGAPQLIVEDLWELCQYHVTTYFNNEVSGIPPARHRSGRALRTLAQRLKGKEGRFRSNLSGKRVDFSARTVISPDPNLSINQVGVPYDIAKILTVPERVTEYNIAELKKLIINGPEQHPGANYVIRSDGRRIDLRFVKNREAVADTLEAGFIIERHLKDNDIVLFNRQPSLHRLSIMAHEVIVMPYKTFRLSLCVCLSGDTYILTNRGKIKIAELVENWNTYAPLSCNWSQDKSVYFSGVDKPHIINPRELGLKSYRITTKNKRTIEATAEHPFYTNHGIIKCENLKIGDSVAIYPIELPEIGGCPSILTKEQIYQAMPDNVYEEHIINELERIGLMDIEAGSDTQIKLASLIGHLFGDGSLLISKEGGRVVFRAQEEEDINSLYKVVESLKLEPTAIQFFQSKGIPIHQANGKVRIPKGKSYFFEIRRKPVAIAFKALGVPIGDRVAQEYSIPEWILNGPNMVKRAFLRSYFGAEMSTARLHTKSNTKFNQLVFKLAKEEGLSPNSFIGGIRNLLNSFNVKISSVKETQGNIRKNGKVSIIYACGLEASDENLLAFFKNIGYDFDTQKEILARLATEYITTKIRVKSETTSQLLKAIELRGQGKSYKEITEEIGQKSWSTVASWFNNKRESGGLPADFPDFPTWRAEATKNLENGFVWDEIISLDEIELPMAYDITTIDDNHNFIAAEFLTKNCPPYNADFDGDEMNLHVPQSEEAQAEARILMRVQEQILTPRYGGPIIGGIQDYLSGAFILTRKSTLFDREQVCNLLMAAGYLDDNSKARYELPPPAIVYPQEYWTGKQVFSVLLPKNINLSLKAKVCQKCDKCDKENCPNDAYVLIRNGVLLSGVVDKKTIGAGQPESLLHRIVKDISNRKGRQFLDALARLLIEVITNIGFTIGLDDVKIAEEAENRIKSILANAGQEVNRLVDVYIRGELQRLPGRTLQETLEMRIMEKLSEARDESGNIAGEYLGIDKHIVIMTKTGARGNPLNLAQMAACVGQQSVRGERILRGYRKRTLPHFQIDDLSASARGFVDSSYYKGLNPIEFFFHAMGGREGLVDTAVRTSQSGYMQRRLINALQDIKIEYDGTVRNAIGNIIQFKYGEDRIDPAKSEHGEAVNIDIELEKVVNEIEYQGPPINPGDPEIITKMDELHKTDQLPKSIIDKLLNKLKQVELDKAQFDALIQETLKSYHKGMVEPGEAVGIVSSQSIGEPGTQMSLPGNEKVIIKRGDISDIVQIGDFIDNLIADLINPDEILDPSKSQVITIPENLQLYVPSLGNNERIKWCPITQISRHLPNGELLKIETRSGRSIKATLSHSFIIRRDNKITPVKGSKLTLGDRIPLVNSLPTIKTVEKISLTSYLPKNEFWYGAELLKAKKSVETYGRNWKNDFGKSYIVPVGIDGLRVALKTLKLEVLQEGYIYQKMQHSEHTKIPEELVLDYETGWFIGAYLAEGNNTGTYVTISNINEQYLQRTIKFSESLGIHYNISESEGQFGPSKSIHLHSTVLATLLNKICGKDAHGKFVPTWAFNASEEFIQGLLSAYFDGNGNVNVEKAMIRASSTSKELIDNICLLLSRMGIFSSKSLQGSQFTLRIPGKYALLFKEKIGLNIPHKAEALNRLAELEAEKEKKDLVTYDLLDMIPGIGNSLKDIRAKLGISSKSILSTNIRKITRKQKVGRSALTKYIDAFQKIAIYKNIDISEELAILKRTIQSDVIWDEITKMEIIHSPTVYVYDFSIDEAENFTTAEGLITHNTLKTFHYAGAAEFNVTLGLPRLIEIVDARRNPSTPMMTVYLKQDSPDEKVMEEHAKEVARQLELTKIENIAQSVEIDLATMAIVIVLDPELMKDKKVDMDFIKKQIESQMKAFKKEDIKGSATKSTIILDPKTDDLEKIQKLLEKVRELPIKGLKGINRVIIRQDEETNEYVIYTDGTNFKETLLIDGVDSKRTVTNHIREIESSLGIEACRASLVRESMNVLEEQGLDVDIRHIMLVADLMTFSGRIRQIGRHGISGRKSSVLARAAFEVTIKHLLEASIRGDEDPLKGITENVIIGQVIPLGTGGIDLLVNPQNTPKESD